MKIGTRKDIISDNMYTKNQGSSLSGRYNMNAQKSTTSIEKMKVKGHLKKNFITN